MSDTRTALVIGITGGIGGEIAAALLRRGWRVRALVRRPHEAARRAAWLSGIEWIAGDAMRAADVVAAAERASLIVHGANPPGYRNWRGLALPMLESTIAAAKNSGARIFFPSTIYNFGPDAFPVLRERSPQHPLTRKGAIRVEMEARLQAAAAEGVRTLIVRAGDFFGPRAGNSWFAQGLVKPGKPLRSVSYPGPGNLGHAWAYLPDLAETVARLVEREAEIANFQVFHFGGHWLEPGAKIAEAVRRAAGNPRLPIRRFPWPLIYLAAPFVTVFREMLEMRYLWREPLRLDNAKLVAFLGEEPHTPLDAAVHASLAGLGCLENPRAAAGLSGRERANPIVG
jgi:nucleoside-diphosphate-sugar epimerase